MSTLVTVTGKARVVNTLPFDLSDGVRVSLAETDAWTPISSSVTFTSSTKTSRGGAGHLGDLSTKITAGPGGTTNLVFSKKRQFNNDASTTRVATISIAQL